MQTPLHHNVLFHGWVVMLLGWLDALPYALAISEAWDPDVVRAWRVAHTGVSGAAVTVILSGLTLPHLLLNERSKRLVAWAMSLSGYGFGVGLTLGAVVNARGLPPSGPVLNAVVFGVNGIATVLAFVGGSVLLYGAWRAMEQKGDGTV